jgi:aspartate racemase
LTVPIGSRLGSRQLFVLDRNGNPAPIGILGELHIGGVALARGYLKRPELTAEKFIPHPFSSEPGARLYKTGDLARYLPDGDIEFLGRMDNQVKIRGFRIELGEIESVLAQHPSVRQAVVLACQEVENPSAPSGNLHSGRRLVAYVVWSREAACTTSELRVFLKQKLPDYMVPSVFVFFGIAPRDHQRQG